MSAQNLLWGYVFVPGKLAVPYFWLKALKALDTAVQAIHRRDECVLEFLVDVRVIEAPALLGSADGPTTTGEFMTVLYILVSYILEQCCLA